MNDDWPQWRGQARDGRVKYLPEKLSDTPVTIWSAKLAGEGIGGIAVANDTVVIISRDKFDEYDFVEAFSAQTGKPLWKHNYEAKGKLDYGNSARATPLIYEDCVYTLGAFGDLHCLELESGLPLWSRNLIDDFAAADLTWGHSGSPLIVDGKLIVQPGGKAASLVALDPDTGETLWESPGGTASYSSFVPLKLNEQMQLIGFDAQSLGGWDVATGKRLWKHVPARVGDFNVPTVLIDRQSSPPRLIVASENNGTRLLEFQADGKLNPTPVAQTRELSPDTHTPVLVGDTILGVWNDLYGIKLSNNFKTVFELRDPAFEQYCSIIGSDERALVMSMDGEILLIELREQELKIASRWKLEAEPASVYSHPAVADEGIYVRLGNRLHKLRLIETEPEKTIKQ